MLNIKKILILGLLVTLPMQVTATSNPAMVPIISYLLSSTDSNNPDTLNIELITTPQSIARVESLYSYTPYFKNSDGKYLNFKIQNKPNWMEFNKNTGNLRGIADINDVKIYEDIIITAYQGNKSIEIPSFSINVENLEALDMSALLATQGSEYGGLVASLSIDDDITTFNHTLDDENNWLQIDLKKKQQIVKIVITPRSDMDWRNRGVKVYLGNKSYTPENIFKNKLIYTLKDSLEFTIDTNTMGRYLIFKGHSFVHIQDIKIFKPKTAFKTPDTFEKKEYGFSVNNDFEIGGLIGEVNIEDSSSKYTYSLSEDNSPFSIDNNGMIKLTSVPSETRTYNINVIATNSDNETIVAPIEITVTNNHIVQSTQEAKETFLAKAKEFKNGDNRDEMIKSYMDYSFLTLKDEYSKYMTKPLKEKTWKWIENDNYIKEGLFSSVFPANPYMAQNLEEFTKRWDEKKRLKYKNIMLGLSINAKESGIYKEIKPHGGHETVRYQDILLLEELIKNYTKRNSTSKYLHSSETVQDGDSQYDVWLVYNYIERKYELEVGEASQFQRYRSKVSDLRKHINENNIAIKDVSPQLRIEYGVSYMAWEVYRILHGVNRDDMKSRGNPLHRISKFTSHKGINFEAFLNNYVAYIKEMDKNPDWAIIGADKSFLSLIMDKSGHITNGNQRYMMMSFLDFANMKVNLYNKPAKVFNDEFSDWPVFNYKIPDLAWQVISTEFLTQKRECEYIRSRFFETDAQKLIDSYPEGREFTNPPHAQWPAVYDLEAFQKRETDRLITYSNYTQAVDFYRPGDWYNASVYGIIQLGGVCFHHSKLEQHTKTCLNQPSIQVGQPGHSLVLNIETTKDDNRQLITKRSQSNNTWESTTYSLKRFFKENEGRSIRRSGLERYSAMVIGTSPSSVGSSEYAKSMMFQRVSNILNDLNISSMVHVKEAIDIAPQNIDAWYQLAAIHAKNSDVDAGKQLVQRFKNEFDREDPLYKDMAPIIEKNLFFTILSSPEIDECKGRDGYDGQKILKDYLNDYGNLGMQSNTNKLNICAANYYLGRKNNFDKYKKEAAKIFNNVNSNVSKENMNKSVFDYVDFRDDEKNSRKIELKKYLLNEFQNYKKTDSFKDLTDEEREKKIKNATQMLDGLSVN